MDAQGRALEALREGAQGMQKQMGARARANGKGGYSARRKRPGESNRATIRSGAGARAISAARKGR